MLCGVNSKSASGDEPTGFWHVRRNNSESHVLGYPIFEVEDTVPPDPTSFRAFRFPATKLALLAYCRHLWLSDPIEG